MTGKTPFGSSRKQTTEFNISAPNLENIGRVLDSAMRRGKKDCVVPHFDTNTQCADLLALGAALFLHCALINGCGSHLSDLDEECNKFLGYGERPLTLDRRY